MGSILLAGGLAYTGIALLVLLKLCRRAREGDDLLAHEHPVAPCAHADKPSSTPSIVQGQLSDVTRIS